MKDFCSCPDGAIGMGGGGALGFLGRSCALSIGTFPRWNRA
jgi:hypothetical protein